MGRVLRSKKSSQIHDRINIYKVEESLPVFSLTETLRLHRIIFLIHHNEIQEGLLGKKMIDKVRLMTLTFACCEKKMQYLYRNAAKQKKFP